MKKLRWLLNNFEEIFMVSGLSIIVIAMAIGVFFRYVLNSSLAWPEEVSRYFLILMAFSGLSYGVRTKLHLRIDLLETQVPRLKKPLEIIGDIAVVGFCVFMLNPAFSTVTMVRNSGQISPAMMFPMYIIFAILLVAFILTIIRVIEKYVKYLLEYRSEKNSREG